MTDDSPILTIIGVIVIGVVILIICNTGFTISNKIGDLQTLENRPCQLINVSDKFTSISGGMLSISTRYYITSDNKTYELIFGSNPDDIQKFRNIEDSVEAKTYKSDAAFCNYKLMGNRPQ